MSRGRADCTTRCRDSATEILSRPDENDPSARIGNAPSRRTARSSQCAWSSRTVGYFIRGDIDPLLEYRLSRLPRRLRRAARVPVGWFNQSISRMRKRAAPRLLARGNREIFREIAAEFARFNDAFPAGARRDDAAWRAHRTSIVASEPVTITRVIEPSPAARRSLRSLDSRARRWPASTGWLIVRARIAVSRTLPSARIGFVECVVIGGA